MTLNPFARRRRQQVLARLEAAVKTDAPKNLRQLIYRQKALADAYRASDQVLDHRAEYSFSFKPGPF